MFKVTIQNVNQYYFSLQDHDGIRISLKRLDFKVFEGLSLQEANHYKKYISLGLSVIIEECENIVEAVDFKIVEPQEEVIEGIEEVQEVKPKYDKDELEELLKNELRALCEEEGIHYNKRATKAELIEMLERL